MGLDQFLSKRHYVQRWDHRPSDQQYAVSVTRGGKPVPEIKPERVSYIEEQVCYWRKSNQIHQWFVENCQGGVDDCRNAYVSFEKLKELLDTVNKVLADHKLAKDLLPTQAGFFFGDTEYGRYYWQDLKETKEMLTALLAEPSAEFAEYQYHSSW